MSDVDFEQYSLESVHFYSRQVPGLLSQALRGQGPDATIVDIGCGDGQLIWSLQENRLLPEGAQVIGADLSPLRVRRFEALTGCRGVLAGKDGHTGLSDAQASVALSTMVIEHVPDDAEHLRELARITRPGGLLYLTTVLRKKGAWYFRKAPDGRRVLDATHLREYVAVSDVVRLVEAAGFRIQTIHLSRLFFPIAHPLLRLWHARFPVRDVQKFFLRPSTSWLNLVGLPIPRYRAIEILAVKSPGPTADAA